MYLFYCKQKVFFIFEVSLPKHHEDDLIKRSKTIDRLIGCKDNNKSK